VGVFTNVDLINLRNQYRSLATMEIPPGSYTGNAIFGTVDAPQVVHVGGDADWNGTISGAGILVVDGDLKLAGNITWKGIVITVSGDVTMDLGGSGNPNLWGTTWVGSDVSSKITNLNINGNPSIKYSYEIIQQVLANLDLLAVEVISWYE
jgi:hypothetical protein